MGVLGAPLNHAGVIKAFTSTWAPLGPSIYGKMVDLPALSVLTMGNPHTKPPPYDFLNLYGAWLQAPRTPKIRY